MRRPGYREGVRWIADNDEPRLLEEKLVINQLTALLLSDLFGVEPSQVARDVIKIRKREKIVREVMES